MSDIQTNGTGEGNSSNTRAETPQIPSEPVAQKSQPGPLEPAPDPADPDYKQKFVESARESILNAERVKVKDAQIEQLTRTDTPTDEAMRLVYPDWDTYNDIAKQAFIKQESQEKFLETASEVKGIYSQAESRVGIGSESAI